MAKMKRIVLCADDYGQDKAVSTGILDLVKRQRLSAVSCLVNTAAWLQSAKDLSPHANNIDVGLHFNLTEGKALSKSFIDTYGEDLFSLSTLMQRSFLRLLKMEVIEAECHAQFERFKEGMGFLPHFIDGHQHVHQFPIIRHAVLNIYQKYLTQDAYIRLVNEKIKPSDLFNFKKIVIYLSGTRGLKHLLKQQGIPHNSSFSGIYSFAKADHYPQLFPRFLAEIKDQGLIMCHPGIVSISKDEIREARYAEYQYLMSDQFVRDCAELKVNITRFGE